MSIVRSGDPAHAATVTITDDGVGMSDETLKRLFEPFYTTKAHGTGLGMSIARKIIELHKGHVRVRSAVGQGTTVQVTLPLSPIVTSVAGSQPSEGAVR